MDSLEANHLLSETTETETHTEEETDNKKEENVEQIM